VVDLQGEVAEFMTQVATVLAQIQTDANAPKGPRTKKVKMRVGNRDVEGVIEEQ
jgi:hypothetical protein